MLPIIIYFQFLQGINPKVTITILKTIAFNAGKKPSNPIIGVSIENFIANISLYALSWPTLNFGCYLTFKLFFKLYYNGKTNKIFF